MPNIDPIYSRIADIQFVTIPAGTASNTAVDGTGVVFTAFTSDSINGGYVQSLRVKAASINTATVLRIFINNGEDNSIASNNVFIDELSIPTITASNTSSVIGFEIPIARAFPPGYKINCCLATSVNGAVNITTFAGKY